MTWRLGYSTALRRVEGYTVFLRAIVMRVSLSATLLPPPAAAQGRKKERASRTHERRERRESNAAVLTVAAYTKPWREHTRSHTSPAPWWPSVCGLWRPRRAGRRARTSSPRSLGGTWDRGGGKRVFKWNTVRTKRSPLTHLHTRRRLLQGQESTSAVEAEMSVGLWTLGEMGPDGSSHKLCRVLRRISLKRQILGFKCHFSFLLGLQNNCLSFIGAHLKNILIKTRLCEMWNHLSGAIQQPSTKASNKNKNWSWNISLH